ncbi:MAG TPA: hypothetical protein PL143_09290 [Rhodocyclaceae bacterium]|nr:hypothetical protein [Rhodocyclaceae bacterium]
MADHASLCGRTLAAVVLALWLGTAAAADATSQPATEVHAPVVYALDVALDPESRMLHGRAELRIEDEAGLELILNRRFELTELVIDGRPLHRRPLPRDTDAVWRVPPGTAPRTVALAWHGPLAATPSGLAHRDTLGQREPTADARGSFLPAGSLWYPRALRDGEPLLHACASRCPPESTP